MSTEQSDNWLSSPNEEFPELRRKAKQYDQLKGGRGDLSSLAPKDAGFPRQGGRLSSEVWLPTKGVARIWFWEGGGQYKSKNQKGPSCLLSVELDNFRPPPGYVLASYAHPPNEAMNHYPDRCRRYGRVPPPSVERRPCWRRSARRGHLASTTHPELPGTACPRAANRRAYLSP